MRQENKKYSFGKRLLGRVMNSRCRLWTWREKNKVLLRGILGCALLCLVACATQQEKAIPKATDDAIEQALASLTYDGPITITKGGTYTGNWQSLDPNVAAVTINTTESVTIQNSNMRARGDFIVNAPLDHIKLTVRGCRAVGLNPNVYGKGIGQFVRLVNSDYAIIENNYFKNTGGIWIVGYRGDPNQGHTIKVRYNRAVNIDGRHSDGNGGYLKGLKDWTKGSFMAFNNQINIPGMEVAWNEVINYPFESTIEDLISGFMSGGTPTSPLRIHDNYLQGGWGNDPLNPNPPFGDGFANAYSGSMIQVGDNIDNKDLGYVWVYHNQIVGNSATAIGVSGGHDNRVFNNRVVSSGALPDGRRFVWGGGIAVVDWYKSIGVSNGEYYYNNRAYNNVTGVVMGYAADQNGVKQRGDTTFTDCAKNADGSSQCTGNKMLPDPITYQTEQNEYKLWQQKVQRQGVKIGP